MTYKIAYTFLCIILNGSMPLLKSRIRENANLYNKCEIHHLFTKFCQKWHQLSLLVLSSMEVDASIKKIVYF